jgi:two-component system, NtrC family, sensor kinase
LAHEIGNPLGIVLGYLDIIKSGKLSSRETSDLLARLETEVTKIHLIIRQMLDFSRPGSGCPNRISLHTTVAEALAVLEPHPMMSRVKVHATMNCAPDIVWADANQLQQVIINIIINAVDAMEDCSDPEITITTIIEDNFIKLSVWDSGPGVDEGSLDRLFEPFYTTKEPGKSTGMGLAVCYRIVEAAGGKIRAVNRSEGGLNVITELPLCDEQAGSRQ